MPTLPGLSQGYGRAGGNGPATWTVGSVPSGMVFLGFQSFADAQYTIDVQSDGASVFFIDETWMYNEGDGSLEYPGGVLSFVVNGPSGSTYRIGWGSSVLDTTNSHWTYVEGFWTDPTSPLHEKVTSGWNGGGVYDGVIEYAIPILNPYLYPATAAINSESFAKALSGPVGDQPDPIQMFAAYSVYGGYGGPPKMFGLDVLYALPFIPPYYLGYADTAHVQMSGFVAAVERSLTADDFLNTPYFNPRFGPGWGYEDLDSYSFPADQMTVVVSPTSNINIPSSGVNNDSQFYPDDFVIQVAGGGSYVQGSLDDRSVHPPAGNGTWSEYHIGQEVDGTTIASGATADYSGGAPTFVETVPFNTDSFTVASVDAGGEPVNFICFTARLQSHINREVANVDWPINTWYKNYQDFDVSITRTYYTPPKRFYSGFPLWGKLKIWDGTTWKNVGPKSDFSPGRLKMQLSTGAGTNYAVEVPGARNSGEAGGRTAHPLYIFNPEFGQFELATVMVGVAFEGSGGAGGGSPDPVATVPPGSGPIYNPWSSYPITGSWQDHMSYSLGGIDYPLGYGTPIAAPAAGTLHVYDGSGEYQTGWVGSAGRRSILYLDQPFTRTNPYLEQNEGSGQMVAIVFQHQSQFGVAGQHYAEGDIVGYSGASANGSDYGGDVHLHVHGLNSAGQRVDFLNFL